MTRYYCPKCKIITSETKDYAVLINKPCIICKTITISKSYKINIEEKETIKRRYRIHNNDEDFIPSKPHIHDLFTGNKINICNREIYNPRIKKVVGILPKKKFNDIVSESKILSKYLSMSK